MRIAIRPASHTQARGDTPARARPPRRASPTPRGGGGPPVNDSGTAFSDFSPAAAVDNEAPGLIGRSLCFGLRKSRCGGLARGQTREEEASRFGGPALLGPILMVSEVAARVFSGGNRAWEDAELAGKEG